MELPNVAKRSSLLIVILFTALLFAVYYVWVFGFMLNTYKDFYKQSSFTKSKEGLIVWIEVPKYYFKAGPATVYVHIENESANIYENLRVYLVTSQSASETPLLLPSIFNDDAYSLGTEIPLLAPYSTATGRIKLITQSKMNITGVFLILGDDQPEMVLRNSHIRFDEASGKAMQLQILEHILLPPWSNVFLSALAVISVFLANRYKNKKDEEEPVFQSPNQRHNDNGSVNDSHEVIYPNPNYPNSYWWKDFSIELMLSFFVLIGLIALSSLFFHSLSFFDYLSNLPKSLQNLFFFLATIFALAFGVWVFHEQKKRKDPKRKQQRQIVVFIGFVVVVSVLLLIVYSPLTLTSFTRKLVLGFLALEGLVSFFMFYRKELTLPTSEQNTSNATSTNESLKASKAQNTGKTKSKTSKI